MKYLLTFFIVLNFLACSKSRPIPQDPPVQNTYLNPKLLKELDFKNQEVIAIKIQNQFYYVRKDGRKISTLTYDGEADKFSDGLARTRVNGKVGFFNRNLDMIIKPIYDFAFPFHNDIAEICVGCKEEQEEGTSMLNGGKWKKINRNGLVIE